MKIKHSSKINNYLLGSLITLTISACVGGGTSSSPPPTPNLNPAFGQWEWVKGESTMNISPVYGTIFTESANNTPGSLMYASGARDNQGNLWVYAGWLSDNTYSGPTAALWKYDSINKMWTYYGGNESTNINYGNIGVESSSNNPGSRLYQTMWIDQSNNIYIFGGQNSNHNGGYNAGDYNDLWKYNQQTNQWVWINGTKGTNQSGLYQNAGQAYPAARENAQSWTDKSGKLWLFSGSVYTEAGDQQYVNDLWKYDTVQNEWTLVQGGPENTTPTTPNGGSKPGIESSSYTPGNRYGATTWTDASGHLWLYGGMSSVNGVLNDLWRYNIATNAWARMDGNNFYTNPVYGIMYKSSGNNTPGSRMAASGWVDKDGNLWLYGGSTGVNGDLFSDLWKYSIKDDSWIWMGGSKLKNQPANYTYFGIASPNITPGGRNNAIAWADESGNFLLFGGTTSANAKGNIASLGLTDIWKLNTNQYQ